MLAYKTPSINNIDGKTNPVFLNTNATRIFSNWELETASPIFSNQFYDVYYARPKYSNAPFSFILKTLNPRYNNQLLGRAIIERDRFIGSISSHFLTPTIDFAFPRALSPTVFTCGFVVQPKFSGILLQDLKDLNRPRPKLYKEKIKRQIAELSLLLNEYGWSFNEITGQEFILTDVCNPDICNLIATDYSTLRRIGSPSLFPQYHSKTQISFDETCQLPPDVFYDNNVSFQKSARAIYQFIQCYCELI